MSERMQIVLLLCLTSMGLTATIGMVLLELSDKPILGHLPAVATGCLVALTGLVTIMGQMSRQIRMEDKIDTIHNSTNGDLTEIKNQLKDATSTIESLKAQLRQTP